MKCNNLIDRWMGILAVIVGNLAICSGHAADGNILASPGFEEEGSVIHAKSSAVAVATVERSQTQAKSGEWCLRVSDSSEGEIEFFDTLPTRVLLQGGGRFYAEAWLRVDNAAAIRTGYGTASLDVAFYAADGKFLGTQNIGSTTSAKWSRLSNVVTLPYEAALIGFRITPADKVAPLRGAVFVDDLYLAPLPVAEEEARVKLAAAPTPPKGVPAYQASPRPTDGRHLTQTLGKLKNGFDPPRPLVIWAIGSSFTDFLGNGDDLIAAIRERFPNAPPIIYKKMVGGSTPWHLTRGWARHLVVPDHPDVVLIYNFGKTSGMEKLLVELRRRTTADIVVGTLHWCQSHQSVWPNPEAETRHLDPPVLRKLCEEYSVEFVESRQEITRYMVDNGLEISDLLVDTVHQSPYAAHIINANIARHFHAASAGIEKPVQHERRVAANSPQVSRSGEWTSVEGGAAIVADGDGPASLEIEFTGSGIDLIGWRTADGGAAQVWIDGKPADQVEAFHASYVQPGAKNFIDLNSTDVNFRRHISDRCPHGISLGSELIPQRWTMTMTGDDGDYTLAGSVTGPDGEGNAFQPFVSSSGQIIVDPELWRLAKTNRKGDQFTFEVTRRVQSEIDFSGRAEKFRCRVVHGLAKGKHTLKIQVNKGGPVKVEAFDVFEPPLP